MPVGHAYKTRWIELFSSSESLGFSADSGHRWPRRRRWRGWNIVRNTIYGEYEGEGWGQKMCIVFTGSRDGRKSSEKTVSRYVARLVAQLGRKHIDCRRRATTVAVYLGIFFCFRAVRSVRWERKRGAGTENIPVSRRPDDNMILFVLRVPGIKTKRVPAVIGIH